MRVTEEATHSDFVKLVLEFLVILPESFDVLQGSLDCLLVCSSYCNHLLLLVPRRGGLMRQISIQTKNMSNQEKIGGSRNSSRNLGHARGGEKDEMVYIYKAIQL